MLSSESSFSTSDPDSKNSLDDCRLDSTNDLSSLRISKNGMSPRRSHVPKRSHAETMGDSSSADLPLSKRFMIGMRKETASLVQPCLAKSPTPTEFSMKENRTKVYILPPAKVASEDPLSEPIQMKLSEDNHPFIPPRELRRALAPLMPNMPVDFDYLLPSLSRLMMMMPEDEHNQVIGLPDPEMVYSAMADVGKAFIKLSDSYDYVKETYWKNYTLSEKLDLTSDDLETARFQLSQESKEVRKLKLQLKELQQAHATELETKVAAAVEAFKSSAEYENALTDARDEGFEECRCHIQSLRPQWDLSFLDHPPNPS